MVVEPRVLQCQQREAMLVVKRATFAGSTCRKHTFKAELVPAEPPSFPALNTPPSPLATVSCPTPDLKPSLIARRTRERRKKRDARRVLERLPGLPSAKGQRSCRLTPDLPGRCAGLTPSAVATPRK